MGHTTITRSYRKRMYRLLDLYEQPYEANFPVVCFDEKSKQLLEEVRKPIRMKPRQCVKYDYEYRRNETRNIFVAVESKAGKRIISVTQTRKKADFAHFIRHLTVHEYRQANYICLVLENLNTHLNPRFTKPFRRQRQRSCSEDRILLYTKACQLAQYG